MLLSMRTIIDYVDADGAVAAVLNASMHQKLVVNV